MSRQLSFLAQKGRTPRKTYLFFTKDHDREDALRRFQQRFGKAPEDVIQKQDTIWLGPVPKKGSVR